MKKTLEDNEEVSNKTWEKEDTPIAPVSKQMRGIRITDKGIIALLEYEAKSLKQTIIILGLTITCLVILVIYLILH